MDLGSGQNGQTRQATVPGLHVEAQAASNWVAGWLSEKRLGPQTLVSLLAYARFMQ